MLRSSRRRSKSSVHLTERWRNRRVSDRFSVRNTKAVRYCSGKRMQSIYPHLLSYSHSSVTPLGLSTYTSTYIFRVKARKLLSFSSGSAPGFALGTGAIQNTMGRRPHLPQSECLCRQRLISDCWQRCGGGGWLFVTLPRDRLPACNWLLCECVCSCLAEHTLCHLQYSICMAVYHKRQTCPFSNLVTAHLFFHSFLSCVSSLARFYRRYQKWFLKLSLIWKCCL